MIMEDTHAIMIPETPNISQTTSPQATPQATTTTRPEWRNKWDHHIPHYKYGKQTRVIPIEEILPKVEEAGLNLPFYLESAAYWWLLYYCGCRGSEAEELRCSQCSLTDTHFIIDFGPRKKHSATTDPIKLRLTWVGVDKIVALWKKRKDFKPTIKKIVTFSVKYKPGPTRRVTPTKDVWLFLNISAPKGNKIIQSVLGKEYTRHFLRLNRCTEIGDQEGASVVQIKSYTGIKSTRVIETAYLGMSRKALLRTENQMDALQPKTSNIPATKNG